MSPLSRWFIPYIEAINECMTESGSGDSTTRSAIESDRPAEFDKTVYKDAANRLERSIEAQFSIINGIDDKAAYTSRLIVIVLGIVFSVIALVVNIEEMSLENVSTPTELGFVLGVSALIISIGASIITYLSSRFRIGLHHDVAYYLEDPQVYPDYETHIKRTVGAYGEVLEQNKQVIQINSARFRRSLYSMLAGIVFLSITGVLFLGRLPPTMEWIALGGGVGLAGVAGWYILGGKYLTLQEEW